MRGVILMIAVLLLALVLFACERDQGRAVPFGPADGDAIDGDADPERESEADGDADMERDADAPCEYDTYRCRGEFEVQRCSSRGVWLTYRLCNDWQVCENGDCLLLNNADDCTPGESICKGHAVLQCRLHGDGYDLLEICDETYGCEDGHCVSLPEPPLEPGECEQAEDCNTGEICNVFPGARRGLCIESCTAEGASCPEHFVCIDYHPDSNPAYGLCRPEGICIRCLNDSYCPDDWYCETTVPGRSGGCRPVCTEDADCIGGLNCRQGRCVVGEGQGDCNGGCPEAYLCIPAFDRCVVNCPDCGATEACDSASAPNCYTAQATNPAVCSPLLPACMFGYVCSSCLVGEGLGYCI